MRYYTFTNFMLSSIQQGIQPAHCIADTFIKYSPFANLGTAAEPYKVLIDWATNHKTMICLNGGNAAGVREIYAQLEKFGGALGLPFCKFHEDEQSLDSTMTCCGIVVTERLYNAASDLRQMRPGTQAYADLINEMTHVEFEFIVVLNQYGLAR